MSAVKTALFIHKTAQGAGEQCAQKSAKKRYGNGIAELFDLAGREVYGGYIKYGFASACNHAGAS